MPVISKKLLDATFAYCETRLWETLTDKDVFAVTLSNGETAYCVVMGNGGMHNAFAIYIGSKEYNTYLEAYRIGMTDEYEDHADELSEFQFTSIDFEQDESQIFCLTKKQINTVKAYASKKGFDYRQYNGLPDFLRYRSGRPCLSLAYFKEDTEFAIEALNGAVQMAQWIGELGKGGAGFATHEKNPSLDGGDVIPLVALDESGKYVLSSTVTPAYRPPVYEAAEFNDTELLSSISNIRKDGVWQCRLSRLKQCIGDRKDERESFFPMCLFIADEAGFALPPVLAPKANTDASYFLHLLAQNMEAGTAVPHTIEVDGDRTEMLLKDFCAKAGIKLKRVDRLPVIDELFAFLNHSLAQTTPF